MKCRSIRSLALIIATTYLCAVPSANAFHDGGVGYCDGCHTLHSNDSSVPADGSKTSLLKGSDPSSTCLGCHADISHEYSIFNEIMPAQTAGGDFSWLKASTKQEEAGRNHGHNVIAADFDLSEDGSLQNSPGGVYPAAGLQCISCHDPHGKIANDSNPAAISGSGSYGDTAADSGTQLGNFRLLGGLGYTENGKTSGFAYGSPTAVAPLEGNGPESDSNHTAYGMGMSEWCANCHTELLDTAPGSDTAKHPAGNNTKLSEQMIDRYNSYIGTGDLSGNQTTAYSALVPFEIGTDDLSLLDPSSTAGPDSNANIMCLTSHRAHASAFDNIGRWEFDTTFIASSFQQNNESYGTYQRQLCAKCHPFD